MHSYDVTTERSTVSVLVPMRNEEQCIESMLSSVLGQSYPVHQLEVILIDGQSSDNTRHIIDEFSSKHAESGLRIRVLNNPNVIVSSALNLGISEAIGDIIIRMDAHADYAEDYVSTCVRLLHQTAAWNVGGPARTRAVGRMQRAIAAAYHSVFSVGGARFHNEGFEGEVDTVTYGCWKRETLILLGGFDEKLVRNQDDELNYRIIKAGGRIFQSPEIRSWYHPRSTLPSLFKQYFQYGFWKVKVIRKHRLPASPRHLVPILFLLGLLLGPFVSFAHASLLDIYLGCITLYLFLLLFFSFIAARKAGWDVFVFLPAVFLTYHTAYGAGFLAGLVRLGSNRRTADLSDTSVFRTLSR